MEPRQVWIVQSDDEFEAAVDALMNDEVTAVVYRGRQWSKIVRNSVLTIISTASTISEAV